MVPSDGSCQSTASLGQLESRPHRPSIFLGEEKSKVRLPQHSSSPRRCSQYRPARLGTDQATSYSISWLLQPPRLLGVALDGTDPARLETSPRH